MTSVKIIRRIGKLVVSVTGVAALLVPTLQITPHSAAEDHDYQFIAKIDNGEAFTIEKDGDAAERVNQKQNSAETINFLADNDGYVGYEIVQYATDKEFELPETVQEKQEPQELVEGVDYHLTDEPLVIEEKITQDQMKPLNEEDLSLARVISVSPSSISIAWKPSPRAQHTNIFVDGKLHETTYANEILIDGLQSETDYVVEMEEVGRFDGIEHVVNYSMHDIFVPVEMQTNDLNSIGYNSVIPTSTKGASALRYVTFITNNRVPSDFFSVLACDIGAGESFGGDNRGFSVPVSPIPVEAGPSYRTALEIIADFEAPTAYQAIYETTAVGATRKYNSNGTRLETRRASESGIQIINPQLIPDAYATFMIEHAVGNPFCHIGAIRYNISAAHIYSSGTITINGTRHPVPAHEMYGLFHNSGSYEWLTMYQGSQGAFHCLNGLCPTQSISNQIIY